MTEPRQCEVESGITQEQCNYSDLIAFNDECTGCQDVADERNYSV